jgi:hypothetical protein
MNADTLIISLELIVFFALVVLAVVRRPGARRRGRTANGSGGHAGMPEADMELEPSTPGRVRSPNRDFPGQR